MAEPPFRPKDFMGSIGADKCTTAKHLLSCTNCRKRKVKCNKTSPCSACDRSSLVCIFPNRARLPRGRTSGSKTANVELLRRVNKLEELLEKANGNPKDGSPKASAPPPRSEPLDSAQISGINACETSENSVVPQNIRVETLDRYMGGNFWKSLAYEIESLRDVLNDGSDEENSPSSLERDPINSSATPSERVWGYDRSRTRLRPWHPFSSQMLILCTIYVKNFDPVFKILHAPTLRRYVEDASTHLDDIHNNKSMEALLFAMYYAAVTSMTREDCTNHLQEDREILLDRYRSGTEIAFRNANILVSSDLITLQALVIFLVTVRCHDKSQFAWTLTAVAIRLAYSLNLHRERPESFSPYTQELRRRLWWHICLLDIHSSEDRGSDPMIHEASFTTRKPLNINDEDLDAENMQPLSDRVGFTEMTLSLILQEVAAVARRLIFRSQVVNNRESASAAISTEDKMIIVSECQQYLEKQYLIYCDPTSPIAWVASTLARLLLGRMWLAVHHPLHQEHRSYAYPTMTREKLLLTSVLILENAHRLECTPSVAHWRWCFYSCVQWHALAVALAELCVYNRGPLVERAWAIIDQVIELWASRIADSRQGMLWRPIQKLMTKAQANRGTHDSTGFLIFPAHPISDSGTVSPIEPFIDHSLQSPNLSHTPSQTDLGSESTLRNAIVQHHEPPPSPHDVNLQHENASFYPQQQSAALSPHQVLPDLPLQQSFPAYGSHQTLSGSTPSVGSGEQMEMINWAEWDDFIHGFELEHNPGLRDQSSSDLQPLNRFWLP